MYMHPKESPTMKHHFNAPRPFPWRCRHCGKNEVLMTTIEYTADVRHDGRLHTFTIPNLQIPVCKSCTEKVFTEDVDKQVNDALRLHLKILTPAQIYDDLKRLDLTQKELAQRLGIAEATLSRWLNEIQIQSRSMDNLLRVFFAFPQVRARYVGNHKILNSGFQMVSLKIVLLPRNYLQTPASAYIHQIQT